MSTFDVRNQEVGKINEIIFADKEHSDGSYQAFKVEPWTSGDVKIYDSHDDYVFVNSEEHARNLIKALEKAIELGWLQ